MTDMSATTPRHDCDLVGCVMCAITNPRPDLFERVTEWWWDIPDDRPTVVVPWRTVAWRLLLATVLFAVILNFAFGGNP